MSDTLADIESLCRGMRRSAARGDWEAVEAALSERDRLVRELIDEAGAAACEGELRRLLDQDREMLALARDARDAVAAELRQLDNGRKAVHAYGGALTRQSRRSIADAATSATDPAEAVDRPDRLDPLDV